MATKIMGLVVYRVAWTDAYLCTKRMHLGPSSHFSHNRHGPKRGGCSAPFGTGELGPRLSQCGLGRVLSSYQVAIIDMGRKVVGTVPPLGGARSPSNTMSPRPRPTSVPSSILIHPAVWSRHALAENWGRQCHFGVGAWSVPI